MFHHTHLPTAAQSTQGPQRTIRFLAEPVPHPPIDSADAIDSAIQWSHLATWFRVLNRGTDLGILQFIFESRLKLSAIIDFQETLNVGFGTQAEEVIRSARTIYDQDRDRLSRIYDAALASKAAYTLSEHLFGHDDPHAVMARDLLAVKYKINKQNFWDFSPLDHPRDSILLEPEDKDGFYVFAVKGTATAQDWINNFDAGRTQNDVHSNLYHAGTLMTLEMKSKLEEILGGEKRVVFTGHSAGAAVAAYVYKSIYRKDWNMDCVLFASAATSLPEVVEPKPGMGDLTEEVQDTEEHNTNTNIRVAFCNRGDPVPRATVAYVEWFLSSWKAYYGAKLEKKDSFMIKELPKDVLSPYGQIVLLETETGMSMETTTTARWATPDQFKELVYLNPDEHPMDRYIHSVFTLLKQSGFPIDPNLFSAVSSG